MNSFLREPTDSHQQKLNRSLPIALIGSEGNLTSMLVRIQDIVAKTGWSLDLMHS